LSAFKKLSSIFDTKQHFSLLLSFIAGALMTLAFAPFSQIWLAYMLMAVLFYLWSISSPRRALLIGWLFGLGMQCTGVCWLFYSLYFHGGSPPVLAALLVFLLSSVLAIFPALAGFLINKYCFVGSVLRLMLLYPIAWTLFEWLQGIALTGFAWMQLGYSQIDTPLSGYAPVLGNHGVSLFVAVTAGFIVAMLMRAPSWHKRVVPVALISIISIWVSGYALKQIAWTEPVGEKLKVSLVQGNIAQDIKWNRAMLQPTLKLYRDLSLQINDTDLIIWPETAVPSYLHYLPEYMSELKQSMQQRDTDLLLGIFIRDQEKGRYYNSLVNVRGGEYLKRHLVPLGEYIPLRFLIDFFNRWIKIPMSDIESGNEKQPLLRAAGQPLGVSICFEDAFARDVIKDLPEATLLVNVSNDAWFDGSHEAYQHHAIARVRALESGRYMLRATNTGISSIIDPHGEVVAEAPRYKTFVLNAKVQPMQGATPYVLWGDYLLLVLGVAVLGWFAYQKQ
jgi:apolipoprotein N-acyltransferase